MIQSVTLEQLLTLSDDLLTLTSKYLDLNFVLQEQIYNEYDIVDIKNHLKKLFSEFKSAKYLNKFPIDSKIKVSANYEIREYMITNSNVSQVENAVQFYVDKQMWVTEVYNSLMLLASKLTKEEAIYMINTFLSHKSEEDIAEKLSICKTSLQKIKKSCLVKMWIELKAYCTENDN